MDGNPLSKAEQYQDELNNLIEQKAQVLSETMSFKGDIFDEVYDILVTSIVASTNAYVAIRSVEDLLNSLSEEE